MKQPGFYLLLLVLLFASPDLSFAQAGGLRGVVVAEGAPIGGATVLLTAPNGFSRMATTTAAGEFSFSSVPTGSVTVTVRLMGYATVRSQASVPSSGNAQLNLEVNTGGNPTVELRSRDGSGDRVFVDRQARRATTSLVVVEAGLRLFEIKDPDTNAVLCSWSRAVLEGDHQCWVCDRHTHEVTACAPGT